MNLNPLFSLIKESCSLAYKNQPHTKHCNIHNFLFLFFLFSREPNRGYSVREWIPWRGKLLKVSKVKDLTNSMSCSVTPNSSSSCCCCCRGSGCDWFGRFGFWVFVLMLERPRRNHEDRSMGSVPLLSFRNFSMIRVRKLSCIPADWCGAFLCVVGGCCRAELRFWFRWDNRTKIN